MTAAEAPPEPPVAGAPSRGYFHAHRGDLAHRLRGALDHDALRDLHHRSAARHALIAARQAVLLGALGWAGFSFTEPWIWVPAAVFQGFVVLSFIILLHDVIHGCVFSRRRPVAERWLARLYALPSAIAATQFSRWHLDHHKELGSTDRDPKRAHLSPKRNARWLKALYMTPVLFLIYARAAGTEAKTYPPALRRTIALERLTNVLLHGALVALLWTQLGGDVVIRVWLVPLFLAFPVAFMVNRLGQHYWVDPANPAKWGTRMDGGLLVNLLFLNSNLHLEHHYFPSVPLYNLPRLNRLLRPFWDGIGHPPHTYRQLLHGWFVRNRAAHTDWA